MCAQRADANTNLWNLWSRFDQLPLVLGWNLDSTKLQLSYWYDYESRSPIPEHAPGLQPDASLALVEAERLQNHVAIIAQSGAGKSVFLGRLLEELCLRTSARCVILDPNADFRRFNEPKDSSLWERAAYDFDKGGQLPHELSREVFADPWAKLNIRIKTARYQKDDDQGSTFRNLHIVWPCVPLAVLAADAPPSITRLVLQEFHTVFHCVARLMSAQSFATTGEVDLHPIITQTESLILNRDVADLEDQLRTIRDRIPFDLWAEAGPIIDDTARFATSTLINIVPRLPDGIAGYYFTRLTQMLRANLAKTYNRGFLASAMEAPADVEVIDLPSIPNRSDRMLALGALLATEVAAARRAWQLALAQKDPKTSDTRRPTYIVIDEAHHLAPNNPNLDEGASALREQLRTIAGEGRKYGLFLIVVSQRPDKLDDVIVSECANKALMKHDTPRRFQDSCTSLGLNDVPEKMRDLFAKRARKGMVLLSGPWASQPNFASLIYAAARRTEEGGRDLRPELWGRMRPNLVPPV